MGEAQPEPQRECECPFAGDIEEMRASLFENGLMSQVSQIGKDTTRLIDVLDGNEKLDIEGLRPRMRKVENGMKTLLADRQRVKWIAVGLGLSGLANVGLAAAAIKAVFVP